MLNKLKFNNLIISHKKQIQQGRVQTVQKCVQKIRKIKFVLEKTPENQKFKDSLRKTLALMEHLKKLKSVEIVKSILLMEKQPNAILTNARASVEETALAMLCMNKIFQDLKEDFRKQLQLDSNDTRWRRELQASSKRRTKIARTEEKRRRRLEEKKHKAMKRKRQEWIENQQLETGEEKLPADGIQTRSGVWKEDCIEVEETKSQVPKEQQKIKKPVIDKKPAMKKQTKKDFAKLENSALLVKTDTAKPLEESDNMLEETQTPVVDEFFITETGDNYLSSIVVAPENKQNDEYIENMQYQRRPNAIIGFQQKQKGEHNYQHRDQSVKWQQKRAVPEWISNKNVQKRAAPELASTNNVQKLHPSWAAKQRFKPVITQFQGNKKTFADGDEKKVIASNTNAQTNAVHPSWAAKQKLKPVITAFQGKKVVFE